jgi:hypothetical protein
MDGHVPELLPFVVPSAWTRSNRTGPDFHEVFGEENDLKHATGATRVSDFSIGKIARRAGTELTPTAC